MIDTPVRTIGLIAVALVVAAVTFVVFSGAMKNGFLNYDDDKYVTDNPRVQTLSWDSSVALFRESRFRSYTPLTFLSHTIDYAIWGPAPAGHHLTNLLLHSANAVWVLLLTLIVIVARRHPAVTGGGHLVHETETVFHLARCHCRGCRRPGICAASHKSRIGGLGIRSEGPSHVLLSHPLFPRVHDVFSGA